MQDWRQNSGLVRKNSGPVRKNSGLVRKNSGLAWASPERFRTGPGKFRTGLVRSGRIQDWSGRIQDRSGIISSPTPVRYPCPPPDYVIWLLRLQYGCCSCKMAAAAAPAAALWPVHTLEIPGASCCVRYSAEIPSDFPGSCPESPKGEKKRTHYYRRNYLVCALDNLHFLEGGR